jgi:hypothetical protein
VEHGVEQDVKQGVDADADAVQDVGMVQDAGMVWNKM